MSFLVHMVFYTALLAKRPKLSLDGWLNEVLVSIDLNNLNERSVHEALA